MPKAVKSQWDFAELFPPAASRRIFSVGELTAEVRRLLERHIGQIWVVGEVTNLRQQTSGHLYFTLKDPLAQLSCVFFRGVGGERRDLVKDGCKLLVQGDITVYEPRGQYQLMVRSVELHGMGALQLAFEKLKLKLHSEGLFATERKRPLPHYPERIGVVTSPDGAALRDVIHVILRRNPGLELVLAPCRVQGDGAAAEIAGAIRLLNEWSNQDASSPKLGLILVTRGGGSLEDLWAFNEEILARAIFNSALPVVSAVGHEIDYTISDFVADLRAATPSAAAEIITEGVFGTRQFIAQVIPEMSQRAWQRLRRERDGLMLPSRRLARLHPRRRLNEKLQQLDDLLTDLNRTLKHRRRECQSLWQSLHQRLVLARPAQRLLRRREIWLAAHRRLSDLARPRLKRWQERLLNLESRLGLLSPEQVLARGYSITLDPATGAVIRRAAQVRSGQKLITRLQSGEVQSTAD